MIRDVDMLLEQADALFQDDRQQEAEEILLNAIRSERELVRIRVKLADLLRHEKRHADALQWYRQAMLQYVGMGDFFSAAALFKTLDTALLQEPDFHESAKRCLDDAIAYYQQLGRRLRPDNPVTTEDSEQESFDATALQPPLDEAALPELLLATTLQHHEIVAIVEQLTPLRMLAGSIVIKEGDEHTGVYVIMAGTARVLSVGRNEVRDVLLLRPGEIVGPWLLAGGSYQRHVCVEAMTELDLLELSSDAMDTLKQHFSGLKDAFNRYFDFQIADTLLATVLPTLPIASRRAMVECLNRKTYVRGSIIYREGDTTNHMSILQKGTVEVFTTNLDGVKITLALLGAGQYFGEGGALSGNPRTASIKARTDIVLLNISRDDLVTHLAHYPQILENLDEVRTERIGDTLEQISKSAEF